MQKKKIFADSAEEKLILGADDGILRFLLAEKAIRGVMVRATRMVNEMRANHELGLLETLVLGQAYIAGGLLSAGLKGRDRIAFRIDCSGPIKGLVVEAGATGDVRGYLKQNPIPVEGQLESFDLSSFFGAGFLEVTRHPEGAKQPFTGQVMLRFGNIAQDLANYYLTSEQIPTAMLVSVQFDQEGRVIGAGGLFIQAMPNAAPELMENLEKSLAGLPSLGGYFAGGGTREAFLAEHFPQFAPQMLTRTDVRFQCSCTEEKIRTILANLPPEELIDIKQNGPFPLTVHCHFCNTCYSFTQEMLAEL